MKYTRPIRFYPGILETMYTIENWINPQEKTSVSIFYISHTHINTKFHIRQIIDLYMKNKTSQSFKILKHALKMFIIPFKYNVHLHIFS